MTSSESKDSKTVVIEISGVDPIFVFGPEDKLLRTIEESFPDVRFTARGNEIEISGPSSSVALAEQRLRQIISAVSSGREVTPADLRRTEPDLLSQSILSSRGKSIRPKTAGQKEYVESIDKNTIVFGIGPAGTGKTYLAMAKAVQALQRKEVSRIILTRPAVEAGERLGFLPGTLSEKIDPYLRPLFDALHEMLDPDAVPRMIATGTIEVAPLAYMRGRTLNDSFIILDEAQNTTAEQMKMFLTRLGFNSKMVVTGDITQVDLQGGVSGLRVASRVLANVEDVYFSQMSSADVIRHPLVGKIVDAYDRADAANPKKAN
ncbi:MAG: AAA family ATPase [Actinobacteria bacterium]|uniref:PhoH-like protein n=3 Tax=freshwater metagenome TaxID=449393 RepID=A0A6J6DKG3_9ZZZZ|nr:AAA family ATPase [Actinomycetota bacterium]